MRAGCIGSPGAMISSPVERMATIGLRQTSTAATPIAASTPVSRLVRIVPAPKHRFAGGDVGAGERDAAAGGDGAGDRAVRCRDIRVLDHHDRIRAARHHAAGRDRDGLARTARPSSARRRCESLRRRGARGAGLPRTRRTCPRRRPRSRRRSSDRTTARRRATTTSAASTRPSASSRAIRSMPRGARSTAARKRRSASSRSRTWRNCSCPAPEVVGDGGSRIEPDVDIRAGRESLAVVVDDHEPVRPRRRRQHRRARDRQRLDAAVGRAARARSRGVRWAS